MAGSYQVIARRWRPKQFDEIVGQEHIVRTLKNAIEHNRIAHAYLFVGPRGTGKTSTARLFAKALNCEGGPKVDPDNDSPLCQAIMSGTCMDVIEIDGASNNSVDQVRDLREDCQYAPAQAQFKIYIIDEVHMLSTAAFNALLKTLEEPPAHVKFMFATTEAQKVLPTITSRCQRFEFRPIADSLIARRLSQIAKAEEIEVDAGALRSIARLAQGGMRDAQSILDQMISFCGKRISEANVLDVYGLVAGGDIEQLARAMASANYGHIVDNVDRWASEGRDLYRLLLDLQARLRDALLHAIASGGRTDTLGTSLTTESLMRMLDVLHAGEGNIRTGLSEKVNFEVTLLRAVDQSRTRAIDSVIKELSALAADIPQDAGQKKIDASDPSAKTSESIAPASGLPSASEVATAAISAQGKGESLPATAETPTPPQASRSREAAPQVSSKATLNSPEVSFAELPESTRQLLDQLYKAECLGKAKLERSEWLPPEKRA